MRKRFVAFALGASVVGVSAPAFAQANAKAEALFQEARVLVEKGRYAEACPKLEESQRLEPAVGTQFNLADCYEHVDKTATAYALFQDVASIARAAGKFEREKNARERIAKLEPRLARFKIVVKADAPGLEVRVDGAAVERARWTEPFPIDPGTHRIAAGAPERSSFERSAEATAGQTFEIVVPELADTRPKVEAKPPSKPSRVLPLAVGAVGLVGIGVGAVFGALSISSNADAERQCPRDTFAQRCPTENGTTAWNDATDQGNVATIGFVVGGVALAAAAVLWFLSPAPKARATATPRGALLEGTF